jgi:hypothetical protein
MIKHQERRRQIAKELIKLYSFTVSLEECSVNISDWHSIQTVKGRTLAVKYEHEWFLLAGNDALP